MVYHRRKGAQLVISPVHETPTGWIPGNPDVHHPTPVILNHWWGWGGQSALQGTSGSGDIFSRHNGERVTQVSNGQRPRKPLYTLQCTGQPPRTKNDSVPKVSSAEAERSPGSQSCHRLQTRAQAEFSGYFLAGGCRNEILNYFSCCPALAKQS